MLATERIDRVVVATLTRPPVNALDGELVARLTAVVDEVAADPEIALLHIRSDQACFCAGADLALMESCFATGRMDVMVEVVRSMQQLFLRLETAGVVTLAEIGGAALGGGLELALACDLRVAATDARLGLPEVRLGLLPAAGGTQRLTRLCGQGTAKRLILGAELIDGAEALRLGIVQWARPRQELARLEPRAGDAPEPYAQGRAGVEQTLHSRRRRSRQRRFRRRNSGHAKSLRPSRDRGESLRIPEPASQSSEGESMNCKDKVAVVTGAASGIGQATAEALAAAGANVIVADIAKEKGEAAAAAIRNKGQRAEFLPVDLTDEASINAFADAVHAKVGAVDILVNGAGWGQTKPFWECTPDLWEKLIALNFVGPMKLVRALLPKMLERSSGKIVNIASDAGRVGSLGETIYSGAKGGLIAFTKSLARETARYNINVNCVCPGPTETPLLFAVPEKHLEQFKKAIPFRRFGKPSEVADAVLFFASDRSSYITGQVLSVSGGLTMVG